MRYKKTHYEFFEKEVESRFNEYRDEIEEEKQRYINEKLNNLRLHKSIQRIELVHFLWDFDAVSLYPSAMWDEKSEYPRIETGYAFARDMNDDLVEKFNNGNFNQGSAFLKIKYYNPRDFIVQHLPVKEKEKKIEINHVRNGYIIDHLLIYKKLLKSGVK